MKPFLIVAMLAALLGAPATPEYSILAIRYASVPDVPVAELVMGGPKDQKIEIAMVVWLIRGGGRAILFDSGFHRETFLKDFPMKDYLRPDKAVETAGVKPEEVTDVVISHAHWDHMGGLDLFPKANVWIQKEEYRYYTMEAWQPGGDHGGTRKMPKSWCN
jgi:glyoxylase-like metal-dependent hydrolase (beta-lactamase superfamily II)